MKKVYLIIGLIGAITPLLKGAASSTEISAEQLARLTPSCASKTSWTPTVVDVPVSWLHDKKPPYVSAVTGAFWSWADAELARAMAQEIADLTGKSVYNKRPVRIIERDVKGKRIFDENGNPATYVSYYSSEIDKIERAPNGEIVFDKSGDLPKSKVFVWRVVHPQAK